MTVGMGIFKAYDIRGVYPAELNDDLAERIGRAFAAFLGRGARTIAVGRDLRTSSAPLAAAAIRGITSTGADVVDLGVVTTPMTSFVVGTCGHAGGLMVTASHNPPQFNGFKLMREQAIALNEDTGLRAIERVARAPDPAPAPAPAGRVEARDLRTEYVDHLLGFARDLRPLSVAIDAANGTAALLLPRLLPRLGIRVTPLFFEPDGRFPGHEPNPMKDANVAALADAVRRHGADLGVAFDGDADRAVFLDETGARIPADLVTALIARTILAREPGAGVVYDLRSSWAVREEIERLGGRAIRARVGHSFMKATLRSHDAAFGGELSGHYYFRDHFYADSGLIACLEVLNLASAERRPISHVVAPLARYHATGELDFPASDPDATIAAVRQQFAADRQDALDGLTVELDDAWFNLRKSNTEALLRLNLEARTAAALAAAQARLLALLGAPAAAGGKPEAPADPGGGAGRRDGLYH